MRSIRSVSTAVVDFIISRGDTRNSSSGLFGKDSGGAVIKVLVLIRAVDFVDVFAGKAWQKIIFPLSLANLQAGVESPIWEKNTDLSASTSQFLAISVSLG